jgi:predicted nucleic acid-binding protein
MSRIFWDSNLFIYLFEGHGENAARVKRLKERMQTRNDFLYTSTFTLGEVLVKPIEKQNDALRSRYEETLTKAAELIPFDIEAARIYATLRQDRSLKAPDAIQLACAAKARVDMFITNDKRLGGKVVAGIHFIVPLSKAML